MITYSPLWNTLKARSISQYKLVHHYEISSGQLYRLRTNQHISTYTLNRLCELLDCPVQDVLQYCKSPE
ncbi:MAG: helix-turn-helix transcriptional regulator [Clostridiales bacterium]|nr:helix-turn-helix transcriptional regulator [Candidatus Blautia equi]